MLLRSLRIFFAAFFEAGIKSVRFAGKPASDCPQHYAEDQRKSTGYNCGFNCNLCNIFLHILLLFSLCGYSFLCSGARVFHSTTLSSKSYILPSCLDLTRSICCFRKTTCAISTSSNSRSVNPGGRL